MAGRAKRVTEEDDVSRDREYLDDVSQPRDRRPVATLRCLDPSESCLRVDVAGNPAQRTSIGLGGVYEVAGIEVDVPELQHRPADVLGHRYAGLRRQLVRLRGRRL